MNDISDINSSEIERRKETVRRVWNYQRVDHIPIGFWIDDFSTYTLREQCENGELQYRVNVTAIERCLRHIPDDYIPFARIWPGYMTIGSMFGIPLHWSDDPNQAPGLEYHPIHDISEVYTLLKPDAKRDGLMPHNIEWLRYHARHLPDSVSLTGIDLGGPINTAKDLLDTNLLYTAFYDHPGQFHYLLDLVTGVQIDCYREIINAAGGMNRLTCIDFDPLWAPEGRKGFVSDDVCASYGPDIFKEFSMPYNNRIYAEFGGGRLHNCGPNPSLDLYLEHEPEIKGLNCSFKYSGGDIKKIKKAFSGRGIVEFNFDFGESFDEIVSGYEKIAGILAPDVIAVPLLFLDHSWTNSGLTDIYMSLRKISERYADNIRWKE